MPPTIANAIALRSSVLCIEIQPRILMAATTCKGDQPWWAAVKEGCSPMAPALRARHAPQFASRTQRHCNCHVVNRIEPFKPEACDVFVAERTRLNQHG